MALEDDMGNSLQNAYKGDLGPEELSTLYEHCKQWYEAGEADSPTPLADAYTAFSALAVNAQQYDSTAAKMLLHDLDARYGDGEQRIVDDLIQPIDAVPSDIGTAEIPQIKKDLADEDVTTRVAGE